MPKLASSLLAEFTSRGEELERIRAKIETLFASGQIGVDEAEQVYAGLFMDLFTEFEAVIEGLFVGLMSGSVRCTNTSVRRRVKVTPASMTQDMVFGFRPYLDWLPYKQRTIQRANNYFDGGRPFTLLSQLQTSRLDAYCVVRNALAHKSQSSRNKFQDLIDGIALLPTERSPAGYLRSRPYAGSMQTQFEIAVLELRAILQTLC